jgi:hypothetical protein
VRARIVVVELADYPQNAVELYAIADEYVMDNNPGYLSEQVKKMRAAYGSDVVTHGFVDVEIPDDVIRSVLNRHADAGVIAAEAGGDTGGQER